jgi:hypothetical protein
MKLDEINKEIKKVMDERNRRGIPEFEDHSPEQMHQIINFLFEKICPIQLKKLNPDDFELIPIFKGVKFLLNELSVSHGIKLTAKGFLPTKLVAELYGQKYFLDDMIEKGISKLYKETDALYIRLCRILLELIGASKKSKGKLTITSKGKKFNLNDQLLLEEILKAYCTKFNWAYFDGCESENIARLGCGFSIILLGKYGKEVRDERFYAKKYFEAYPMLKENIVPTYGTTEEYVFNCYSYRMMEQFGLLTGMISIENDRKFRELRLIRTTELFEKLIHFEPKLNC